MKTKRTKIRNILEFIEEKAEVKENSKSAVHTEKVKSEQTYLKKTDAPKFLDSKRKWLANVSKANLSAKSKLDRLKDNVHENAAKMMFGQVRMDGAWATSHKILGNKT